MDELGIVKLAALVLSTKGRPNCIEVEVKQSKGVFVDFSIGVARIELTVLLLEGGQGGL